jgi:hypothetical protein
LATRRSKPRPESIPFPALVKLAGQSEERTGLALAAGALDYEPAALRERGGKLYASSVALPWLLLTVELLDLLAAGAVPVSTTRAALKGFRGRMEPAWTTALRTKDTPSVWLTKPGDPSFKIELSFLADAVSRWRSAQSA